MSVFVRKNANAVWMFASVTVFLIVIYFTVGFGKYLQPRAARAATTITWDNSSGDGKWETATNWDINTVPTSTSDVILINGATVTVSTGQTANFGTLQIGQGASTSTLILSGNIGTGGSITIKNHGVLEQRNTNTQTITGTLTLESGAYATHTSNTSTQNYELDMSMATLDAQSGSMITVEGKGYGQGVFVGAHAGLDYQSGSAYPTAYCDVLDPLTIGGGGTDYSGFGYVNVHGGGLIRFNVSGTATLSGTVTAKGGAQLDEGTSGAGGGINITANVIAGTPQSFNVAGGDADPDINGESGGGGCAKLQFTTSNSIDGASILVHAGNLTGRENDASGSTGTAFVKQVGGQAKLFLDNQKTYSSDSYVNYFNTSTLILDMLSLKGGAYVIATTSQQNFNFSSSASSYQINGDGTGTFKITTGTLGMSSTFTIASSTVIVGRTATVTNSSTANLVLAVSSTLSLDSYSTTTPFRLNSLTIQSGGTLTHSTNPRVRVSDSIINFNVGDLIVNSGGTIDADSKGFVTDGDYSGWGQGGLNVSPFTSSGSGHGGAGGADQYGSTVGSTYCDSTNPMTFGSAGRLAEGNVGGGLILINASGTVTLNGTVRARSVTTDDAGGGGSGGGINITANTISGTPQSLSVAGGNGSVVGADGGGGGGCIRLNYTTSNSINSATVTGGTGYANGSSGTFSVSGGSNTAPTATTPVITHAPNTSGDIYVRTQVDDADDNALSIKYEYKSGTCSAYTGQVTSTISTSVTATYGQSSIAVTNTSTNGYQLTSVTTTSGINTVTTTWNSATDSVTPNTTYCIFVTPYDGTGAGTVVSSTIVTIANAPSSISVSSKSSSQISLTWNTNSNPNGTEYYIEDANNASRNSGWISTASYSFTSLSAEQEYTFKVKARNSAGLATSYSSNFAVMTSAVVSPGGGVGDNQEMSATVSIVDDKNRPLTQTRTRDVFIKITSNNADRMYLAENSDQNVFPAGNVSYIPIAQKKAWTLTRGDGQKCVHVRFLHSGQNSTFDTVACVALDTTPPKMPRIIEVFPGNEVSLPYISGTAEPGAYISVRQSKSSLAASDRGHVFLSLLGNSVSTFVTSANDAGDWRLNYPDYFIPGTYNITVTQTDNFGNTSEPANTTMKVNKVLDVDPGGEASFYQDGKKIASTNDANVELRIAPQHSASYVYEITRSKDFPELDQSQSISISSNNISIPVVLPGADGLYCVHLRFFSPGKTKMFDTSDCVFLDTIRPVLEIVSVDTGSDKIPPTLTIKQNGASSISGAYALVADDGKKGKALEALVANSPSPVHTFKFTKTIEPGTYEFFVNGIDAARNEAVPVHTRIVVTEEDLELAPNGSISILELHNGKYVNTRNVTVQLTASNVTTIEIDDKYGTDKPEFSGTARELAANKRKFSLTEDEGQQCVHVRMYSKSGRKSRDAKSCFILDTVPPQSPIVSKLTRGTKSNYATAYGTAEPYSLVHIKYAKNLTVSADTLKTVSLASRDIKNLSFKLAASEAGSTTVSADAKGSWQFTLPAGTPGQYTLTLTSEDPAGNVSPAVSAQAVVETASLVPIPPKVVPEVPPLEVPPVVKETPVISDVNNNGNNNEVTAKNSGVSGNLGDLLPGASDVISQFGINALNSVKDIAGNVIQNIQSVGADVLGAVNQFISTPLSTLSNAVNKVGSTVAVVTDNQVVEEVNQNVAVPIITAVGVANAAASGIPEILTFLRFIFGQPFLLLRRRRLKRWGVVYNAFTKQPVDLAMIRLLDARTGKLIRSQVTDTFGRYLMIVNPGSYRLEASRPGYSGFSEYLKSTAEDGTYINLYNGKEFTVTDRNTQISYNIPLDPSGTSVPTLRVIRDRSLKSLQYILGVVGIVLAVASFIISPKPFVAGVLAMHVFIYMLMYLYVHRSLPSAWGVVTAADGVTALPNTVVRLFDVTYNKLIDTKVTDKKGRYAFLVGPRSYYVTYEKPGYSMKKSPVLDFAVQNISKEGSLVHRDEQLSPVSFSSTGNNGSKSSSVPSVLTDSLFSDLNQASESTPNQTQPEEKSETDTTSGSNKTV